MSTFGLSLCTFHISDKYGFMLEDPLEILPVYFQPWNDLAKNVPSLVASRQLREKVNQLELLDHTRLQGYRQYRLAHLQLCMLASSYIWQDGDSGVSKVLPKVLAVPWYGVSEYLGIHAVISHPSLVLANWKLKDPNGPVEVENLQSLYLLPPGGEECDWFITVTAMVELEFAKALKPVLAALEHAKNGEPSGLKDALDHVTDTVIKMKSAMTRMHDKLSGDTFYNKMRPFLQGFGGIGSPLADGLIFEGVSEKPMQAIGGSAAQSSTMQVLDSLLGLKHETDKQEFLHKMRDYMPPAHKDFIEVIAQQSKVKHLVEKACSDDLKDAFNKCVAAVIDFRSYHIQLVTKYIVIMSNKASRNKDFEAVSKVGTGGSSVIPFLKSLRESTKAGVVAEVNSAAEVKSRNEEKHDLFTGELLVNGT